MYMINSNMLKIECILILMSATSSETQPVCHTAN